MGAQHHLSVVVPTRDRPALLEACVASLRASLRTDDELIVVDSASRDGSATEAAAGIDARCVRCETPGASRARNAGWHAARHDVVAFVDDDVRVSLDWAEALAAVFTAHPEVDFVTGRIDVPAEQADYGRPVAVCDRVDAFAIEARSRGVIGHGANLAVRRHALDRVGGFDEALGGGARLHASEDKDLIDRLLAAGFRGRYEPSVRAEHVQWRSKLQLVRLDWGYGVGSGARLAKLMRTNRRAATTLLRESVWGWGFASLGRSLQARYKLGVATDVARLAGMATGLLRGSVLRVRDGHFAPRVGVR